MFTKINPFVVVKNHFGTFGDRHGNGKWKDIVVFFLTPAVAGAVAYFFHGSTAFPKCADDAIVVLSIFVPLAFALLSQLVALEDRDLVKNNRKLRMLISHLYSNIVYGILVALATMATMLAAEFFGVPYCKWYCVAFAVAMTHLLLTLLMIVKRFAVAMNVAMQQ